MKPLTLTVIILSMISISSFAEDIVFHIEIRNHLFVPDTLTVPAGKRFKLIIDNKDATPEEFESFELNREKVVMGHASTSVFIGPLRPGTYPFFGEFNPETAQGQLIAVPDVQ